MKPLAVPLVCVALVVGISTVNASLSQSKEQTCENIRRRVSELTQQATLISDQLALDADDEAVERRALSDFNDALSNPSRRRDVVARHLGSTVSEQAAALESLGLKWKNEYVENKVLLLRAAREAQIRRVQRISYARTHHAELRDQQREVGKQLAYQYNQMQQLGCGDHKSTTSTDEPSADGWQKAIGKWRNKAGLLVFELVDMNKADREYHPGEPIKVQGYVRKVPPTWPDKIHVGDLIFISNKVEGDTISGKWISVAQKGDCPKLSYDFSSCSLKINTAGDTLTHKIESKQYWYPKCEWSDKVKPETFTYYRVK